jgi:PAS domain S-box-containing protein
LLQAELAQTNREVLALTLEMDGRVEERTAELRAAQDELQKTNSELLQLTLELEQRVAQRTEELSQANAALRAEIAEHKQADERVAHLNRVLLAVRNVNQLITHEKDREKLLQQACQLLTETRGYSSVFILLHGQPPRFFSASSSGLADPYRGVAEQLLAGGSVPCLTRALASSGVVVMEQPRGNCTACPMASPYRGDKALAVRLDQGGRTFGVLSAALTEGAVPDEEEQSLFREVAGDLAYALSVMEEEERRKRAEGALLVSETRYRRLFESAKDGILILDAETGMIVDVNPFLIQMLGYSREIFLGKKVWELGFLKDLFANQANFTELQKTEYIRYDDMPLESADRRRIDVEFVSNVYFVNHKKVIQCNIRDITERKRAEQALKSNEVRYRQLVENMSSAVAVYEAVGEGEDFIFKNFNAAGEAIEQVKREDLIGKSVRECFPGVVEFGLLEVLQRVWKTGVPEHKPAAFYRDNRISGWRENYICRLPGGEVVAVYDDITEHKRAEKAMLASEARYRRLFESARDGILILDAETGMVVDVNPFLVQLLGHSREAFLEKKIWELGFFRDIVANQANFTELQQKEYIHYEDMALETSDGRRIEVEFVSYLYLVNHQKVIQCNIRDIAERKQAEEALRESEARFQSLVEAAPEAIFVQSRGRFVYVNPAVVKLLGASGSQELLGTEFMERIAPEYREIAGERIRLQNETGNPAPLMEQEYLRPDGSRVTVETTAVPIRFKGRDSHLVFLRDVTARKQMEAQYLQAQKMEAIGRLAGGVAHDFNNLLTVILGRSELLLMRHPSPDSDRHSLELIEETAKRAAALTRQLLQFSRQQVMRPRILNLNTIVTEMENMLRRLIGEDVELATDLSPNLGRVKADPTQLQQVIMNLAVNARDAMPDGGRLCIRTAPVELDIEYAKQHVGVTPGDYMMLSVSDTGCGMDKSTQARLFEPFFTTKEVGKGTGLGLPTAHGIVGQSGGHIAVYSELGRGTTFKVYLPSVQESGAPAPTSSATLRAVPSGEETVLLVEDEEVVRDLIRDTLTAQGYRVLTARNGKEALQMAAQAQGPIHLLLTDVVMPELGGPELAQRLVATRPDLQVMFMSGYASDAIGRRGVLDEGISFLEKPFTPSVLGHKVREVLGAAPAAPKQTPVPQSKSKKRRERK